MARCCDCMHFDGEGGVYRCMKTGEPVSTHSVALPLECSYFLTSNNNETKVSVKRKYKPDENEGALSVKLKKLEEEYRLARMGLGKGLVSVMGAMICFLSTFGMTIWGRQLTGQNFLSGTHLVIIAIVLAFAVIIYFSFVFGRKSRLAAEISETKAKIEMVAGENER